MQPSDESSHQQMGYDRTSIMFSPDGRLLQVEYAKKTVRQGSTAIGMVCKDGVIIVADKRITEKLIIPKSIEKVFQVDEHIAATASGILSDGRVLIERAQVIAQQHRLTYADAISTESLVKEICNLKQLYTQVGGARPFGVSILFAGQGEESHIFVTDPTGIFFEYKATAIGEDEVRVKEILTKEYRENMTIDEGLKLAVSILKRVMGKNFNSERLDGACITSKERKFQHLHHSDFVKLK